MEEARNYCLVIHEDRRSDSDRGRQYNGRVTSEFAVEIPSTEDEIAESHDIALYCREDLNSNADRSFDTLSIPH